MTTPSEIQRLRSQSDIIAVAAAYTTLKEQSPGDFWGQCPLHSENTESFHVMRDNNGGFFKCFGCGEGGDVFALLEAAENLTFPQAIERLSGEKSSYTLDDKTRSAMRSRREKRKAAALPTGEKPPANTLTLTQRGHDMDFLLREFGVKEHSEEWCGDYWEYPTTDTDGNNTRRRRKFRDKNIAKKKYHYVPNDKHPEPIGYPLLKITPDGCEELWLVNGEPSVWLCWQEGIAAACTLSETNRKNLPKLLKFFKARGVRALHILLDNDEAGREGTRNATAEAIKAGYRLITSADPLPLPRDARIVVPHVWHPSTEYPKGYDVADLHADPMRAQFFVALHATKIAGALELSEDSDEEIEPEIEPVVFGLEEYEKEDAERREYYAQRELEQREQEKQAAVGKLTAVDFSRSGSQDEDLETVGNTVRKKKVAANGIGSRKKCPTHEQFETVMEWMEEFPKVRTPNGEGFVMVKQAYSGQNHTAPLMIDSKEFADYISHTAEAKKFFLTGQAESLVVKRLGGLARTEGKLQDLYLRVAGAKNKDKNGKLRDCIYVDLGDEERRVVEISAEGWRVVGGAEVQELPVMFRRSHGMEAMPLPIAAKTDSERTLTWQLFRDILRPGEDDNWVKMVAWILQCFRKPVSPYVGLCVTGQQNSGKTVRTRMMRMLVDPHKMRLISSLRREEDFESIANSTFVMGFENLSKISDELSDKFCQVATDGRFAGRVLHTTMDIYIIEALRPILLNGITDFVQRADLKRRFLFVQIPPFASDTEQRGDTEVYADFDKLLPKLLGVVFDAVSASLRHINDEDIRAIGWEGGIIDFARSIAAAEKGGALPWKEQGVFHSVYSRNLRVAVESALADSASAQAVMSLVEELEESGDMTDEGIFLNADMLYNRLKRTAGWLMLDRSELLESKWSETIGGQRYNTPLFEESLQHKLSGQPIMKVRAAMREDARRHYDSEAEKKLSHTKWPSKIGLGKWLIRDAPQLRAIGIRCEETRVNNTRGRIVGRVIKEDQGDIFDDE